MGIRTTETKRTDPGTSGNRPTHSIFQRLPIPEFRGNIKRTFFQFNIGIECIEMDGGRQFPVFHGKEHLEYPGNPCRGFEMADVGFHRAQSAVLSGRRFPLFFIQLGKRGFQSPDLNGISQSCASAVGFNISDSLRTDTGGFVCAD